MNMTGVLIRRVESQPQRRWRQRHKRHGHVPRDTKDYQHLPKVGKRHETNSPSEPPKGSSTAHTLIVDFWLP